LQGGQEALDEVQRRALAGETVEDYQVVDDDAVPNQRPAILRARPHRDSDGSIVGVIVGMREVPVPSVKERAPATDSLTGLADRHQFTQRLREILSDPDPEQRAVVVFAVNLDGFRSLNILYGPTLGDEVLRVIAERLFWAPDRGIRATRGATRAAETWLPGLTAMNSASSAARRCCRRRRRKPSPLGFRALSSRRWSSVVSRYGVTAGIGFITTTPAHLHADDVLRDLDLALRQAKTLGSARCSPGNRR